MAEVAVWIEQDGSRITYTVENADKVRALRKAESLLARLVESVTDPLAYMVSGLDVKSGDAISSCFRFYEG